MNLSKIKNSLRNKKAKTFLAVLLLACVFSFLTLSNVDAQTAIAGNSGWSWNPIKWLLVGVQNVMLFILSIAATIFGAFIDPKNISDPATGILNKQAILDVWIMVRDVLNMAFILILLFAAFCTIFQVEKWSIKKVWLNILINALLVNFSFTIARFIIDVSNVAMYYFVNNMFSFTSGGANGSAIMANLASTSKLAGILKPANFVSQDIAYQLMIIIFTFILAMTLLIIAILFVIRTVALAILIMFSPVGFVGYIFPSTQKYADQWWSNLFNYSFFAPIMVFMLGIALSIVDAIGRENYAFFVSNASNNTTNSGETSFVASATFFSIPIIILWFGMGIAKSMSIAGADTVVGAGQNFAKWAGYNFSGLRAAHWFGTKAVPGIAKAGLKKFDRDVLGKWSPRGFVEGWKANSAAKEEAHLNVTRGAWRDRLNNAMSFGKDKTHYEDAGFQANVLKKAKELGDVSQESEYLMQEYKNAMQQKDKKTMCAVLRLMFNNNDQNEYMKLQGQEVDPLAMKQLIFNQLQEAGMTKADAAKQLTDFGEIAVSKGNYANYGMAKMGSEGKFTIASDEEQIAAAAGKARNIKAQSKADSWHWNSFCIENESIDDADIEIERKRGNLVVDNDGKVRRNAHGKAMRRIGRLHEVGLEQLNNLTPSEVNASNRVRSDFYDILKQEESISEYIDKLKNGKVAGFEGEKGKEQAKIVENFIATLKAGKSK